jgi:DNA-binding transcriptional LysR family regulator
VAVDAARAAGELSLRAAAFGFAAYDILPQITRRLAAHDPPVTVVQLEIPDRTAVLDGRADVALGTSLDPPAGITAEPVFTETVVVALPDTHPLATSSRVTLGDLAARPVAMPAAGVAPEWDQMIATAARRAGVTLTAAPVTFRGLATAVGVAVEGRHPALLTSEARRWPLPGVTLRPLEPRMLWTTAMLWPAHRPPSPALHAFVTAGRRLALDNGWLDAPDRQ